MKLPAHLNYAHLPTPIIPIERFFNGFPEYEIKLKRDDFTGLELSGNKVRKLDFLFKDAQSQGAKHVLTCGGLQSNHCRATAFYATKLGMKTTLVLRGKMPENPTGNLLLNLLLGVPITFMTDQEYKQADQIMADIAEKLPDPAYIIPEGGSNEIGAWGYVKAFNEIIQQDSNVDTIVSATGSGGTHAGLLLGKLMSGSPGNIISVNVCDDEDYFKQKIDSILKRFGDRYGISLNWHKEDIKILDGFVGKGYAKIDNKEADFIKRFAHSEGIVMDPVYGVKALMGLEHNLKQGNIPGRKILFIHTGGTFGLFHYGDMF